MSYDELVKAIFYAHEDPKKLADVLYPLISSGSENTENTDSENNTEANPEGT